MLLPILTKTSAEEATRHDLNQRKKLGAFYTPLSVSKLLSAWGIRKDTDRVLEPCFGGCTFLESAVSQLKALGNETPERNLYGCDIDPVAFTFLRSRIANTTETQQFFEQDFLTLSAKNIPGGKVDLVLGNPPYISYENIVDAARLTLNSWRENHAPELSRRASLWAHFVLHSLEFLKAGGRIALVLPGSFLYAAYAEGVRSVLRKSFSNLLAISLAERLFVSEGTEETTVVLLGEGYLESPKSEIFPITCVESVEELGLLTEQKDMFECVKPRADSGNGIIPDDILDLYRDMSISPDIRSLGQLAKINIGLVTGDSAFFIKSHSAWRDVGIDRRHLRYILPRSQYVSGISINFDRARAHINDERKCLALSPPDTPRAVSLLDYLRSYPEAKRKNNATFAKREPWYDFNDDHIPNAFFVLMTALGPRLVLNEIDANATNGYYRVFFNAGVTLQRMKLACISIHSTYSKISAEIYGHPRGSGALKLEPSGAAKIKLFMPDRSDAEIFKYFSAIDKYLADGLPELARQTADEFLFADSEFSKLLPAMRQGLDTIRARRSRPVPIIT